MLKLEKKSKSRDIRVILQEYGYGATSTFWQAFGLAVALHLTGLIIFQITPFRVAHVTTIFPPIQVKIDYQPLIDQGVLSELQNNPIVMSPVPSPPLPRPQIESTINPVVEAVYFKNTSLRNNSFENLNSFHPQIFDLKVQKPTSYNRLDIHLSGGLANQSYRLENIKEEETVRKYSKHAKVVAYRVKVENRRGRIFWYEPINATDNKATSKVAKKIFHAMRFQLNSAGFISEGEISIGFL